MLLDDNVVKKNVVVVVATKNILSNQEQTGFSHLVRHKKLSELFNKKNMSELYRIT